MDSTQFYHPKKTTLQLIMQSIAALVVCLSFLFIAPQTTQALEYWDIVDKGITPIPCGGRDFEANSCPTEMLPVYEELGEPCAVSFADFETAPEFKHFWIEDPEVTAQGKADERARQFISWAINSRDTSERDSVLSRIWGTTSMTAFFFIIIVVIIFGIGFIISSKTNFQLDVKVWPTVIKIALMLIYVSLSFAIIVGMIGMAELLMNFFIENLGGRDLFNIYFTGDADPSNVVDPRAQDANYTDFIGCRDLNIRVHEAIDTEMFMLDMTNVSYYTMGTMILLRKILLWFLLFVSPFLAILMPFIFIRNTGWIWIGVFFQWLFYGPLLALFLGAMNQIWRSGIPFNFDFSRVISPSEFNNANSPLQGYTYPTGINILYGGPGQLMNNNTDRRLSAINNGSYIDTFAEYIITLLMIWAVTFFPWWLLRIFRDYCCDGIYALRNIMLNWYNQWSASQGKPPSSSAKSVLPPVQVKVPRSRGDERPVHVSLGTVEQIRSTTSVDIPKSLNIHASKMTDIANMELNKDTKNVVMKNLQNLSRPTRAESPREREQFMNLRTELFNRSVKQDVIAKRILGSTSTSRFEQIRQRAEIIKSIPKSTSVTRTIASQLKIPHQKATSITNSYMNSVSNQNKVVNSIAKNTNTTQSQVQSILRSYAQATAQPAHSVIKTISTQTNIAMDKVRDVIKQVSTKTQQSNVLRQVATKTQVEKQRVSDVFRAISSSMASQRTSTSERSVATQMARTIGVPLEKATSVMNTIYKSVANSQTALKQIQNNTHLSQDQVKSIVTNYAQNISQSASRLVQSIAEKTQVSHDKVVQTIQQAHDLLIKSNVIQSVSQKESVQSEKVSSSLQKATQELLQIAPASYQVSQSTGLSQEKAQAVTNRVYSNVVNNTQAVEQIAGKTGVSSEQVKTIIKEFSQNTTSSISQVAQHIATQTNTTKEKVQQVVRQANTMIKEFTSSDQLAQKEQITREQAEKAIETIAKTKVSVTREQIEQQQPTSVQVSQKMSVPAEKAQSITNTVYDTVTNNTQAVEQVVGRTGIGSEQVKTIIKEFSQNATSSMSQVVDRIATQTNTTKEKVSEVIQEAGAIIKEVVTSDSVAEKESITKEQAQKAIETISKTSSEVKKHVTQQVSEKEKQVEVPSLTQQMTQVLSTPVEKAQSIMRSAYSSILKNVSVVQNIQQKTNLSQEQVQNIVSNYSQHTDKSVSHAIQNTATQSNVSQETVRSVIQQANTEIQNSNVVQEVSTSEKISTEQAQQAITTISEVNIEQETQQEEKVTEEGASTVDSVVQQTQISEEKAKQITNSTFNAIAENEQLIQNIQEHTGLEEQQVRITLETFAKNIDKPADEIAEEIEEAAGVDKEEVQNVLETISEDLAESEDVVEEVAEIEEIEPEQISEIMEAQFPVAADPEENVEQTIEVPPNVSLDEYEEVKKMWMDQYEKGEVPVSENISSRLEWVQQDSVAITNTLNKLVSEDEELKQQGLDELGFILPVFMINNLKGEELIVYLKAKAEAAKTVQKQLALEQKLREEIMGEKEKEEEETLLEVDRSQKEENTKTMQLDLEEEQKKESGLKERLKKLSELE